jgi:hypothetical protein
LLDLFGGRVPSDRDAPEVFQGVAMSLGIKSYHEVVLRNPKTGEIKSLASYVAGLHKAVERERQVRDGIYDYSRISDLAQMYADFQQGVWKLSGPQRQLAGQNGQASAKVNDRKILQRAEGDSEVARQDRRPSIFGVPAP